MTDREDLLGRIRGTNPVPPGLGLRAARPPLPRLIGEGEPMAVTGEEASGHRRRRPVLVFAVAFAATLVAIGTTLLLLRDNGEGPVVTTPPTMPPPTTTTAGTTTSHADSTTTTTHPEVIAAPVGRLEGTVGGWPDDAVACSVRLVAWGPYPYREVEVECAPGVTAPLPFAFEVLPVGNWGVRVWLFWTDNAGDLRSRMNEFPGPAEPPEWIPVTEGATTTVQLMAHQPGGRIAGTVTDSRAELPIGGQYEPGASLIGLLAYAENGTLAGMGGNACDGSYEIWLPQGRYAVAAIDWSSDPARWRSAWQPGGQDFAMDPEGTFWSGIDPVQIPEDAWVAVADGTSSLLSPALDAGPGWMEPNSDTWFPWWVPPDLGEPLPPQHPWRDPAWWIGQRVALDDRPEGDWPPRLLLDGVPVDLGGWARESIRGAGDNLVVSAPYPPSSPEARPGAYFVPGYRIVLAADPTGLITDALYLETDPRQTVTAESVAPHIPGVSFVVVLSRPQPCDGCEGEAVR
ncbi:MAG: hypothetical protein FJ313_03745, partial [Gemmatimonadetes bacterium]|nr:hypothetical protein [Gemmatimonadota bacterium]